MFFYFDFVFFLSFFFILNFKWYWFLTNTCIIAYLKLIFICRNMFSVHLKHNYLSGFSDMIFTVSLVNFLTFKYTKNNEVEALVWTNATFTLMRHRSCYAHFLEVLYWNYVVNPFSIKWSYTLSTYMWSKGVTNYTFPL